LEKAASRQNFDFPQPASAAETDTRPLEVVWARVTDCHTKHSFMGRTNTCLSTPLANDLQEFSHFLRPLRIECA